MAQGDVLRDALDVSTGQRCDDYGTARDNLGRTAGLMNAYLDGLDRPLEISDVAALMILVKVSRLHRSPTHYDTLVDIAGYASAAWDATEDERGGS